MVHTASPRSSHHQIRNVSPRNGQRSRAAGLVSSYAALLTPPLSGLAGNTLERADVASVAILGYN
jgi:hypothetical protein